MVEIPPLIQPKSPQSSDETRDARLQALLSGCAAGDGSALKTLYDLVSPALFACLVRMLRRRAVAEEALQDVFVTVWERAAQYEPSRGSPMAWLTAIARYRAIDLLRRDRATPTLISGGDSIASVGSEAWETDSQAFERCFQQLTRQQQQCLELAYLAGQSHGAIAESTGNPLGTIKSWIRRGLQSLKACLEQ